jgi:hypothetical protein
MRKVLRSPIVYVALAAAIGFLLFSLLQSGPDRKTITAKRSSSRQRPPGPIDVQPAPSSPVPPDPGPGVKAARRRRPAAPSEDPAALPRSRPEPLEP